MSANMETTEEQNSRISSGRTVAFMEVACLLFGISAWILLSINQEQPSAYMDEVFHIPQAERYCKGNFMQWDNKITTLPGLYIISVGIIHPTTEILTYAGITDVNLCSTFWLRSINLLFMLGNMYVLLVIYRKLHGEDKEYSTLKALLVTTCLTTLPVLYFFSFLYYTDPGATFFALLMYLLHLYDSQFMSACMGLIAVCFRQTNMAWVFFVAAERIVLRLAEYVKTNTIPNPEDKRTNVEYVGYTIKKLFWHPHKSFVSFFVSCFTGTFFYQIVGALFAYFLWWNKGSAALGDHAAHPLSIHLAQLLYFLLFLGFFAFPYLFSYPKVISFLRYSVRHPITIIATVCAFTAVVMFFTEVHPYLLSDNRHFTFYIWQRLFARHWLVPYSLIPLYAFLFHSLTTRLQAHNLFWKLILFVCVALCFVPQKLIELRYFIVPYLIIRLHMPIPNSYVKILLELVLYCAVNVITIKIFIEKTFHWEGSDDVQRFMW